MYCFKSSVAAQEMLKIFASVAYMTQYCVFNLKYLLMQFFLNNFYLFWTGVDISYLNDSDNVVSIKNKELNND